MTHQEINIALCNALGIDPATVVKVEIVIEAGKHPRVTVEKRPTSSEFGALVLATREVIASIGSDL